MSELNRREFVMAAAAACACTFACGGSEALAQVTTSAPAGPVDAGPVAKFASQGISDALVKTQKVALIRHGDKLYATTAVCSHKNRVLNVKGNQFVCPAHGSIFSVNGTVEKGPAKVSLYRYGITVNADKHVIVDKTKQFEEKDWENPAAFVKMA
jgi:nitrite reductase/ring-hydroxylating ferredoxin subunit